MNALWACVRCDGPQEVAMVDATAIGDLTPRWIEGMHEACPRCGSTARPIKWQRALYRPAIRVQLDTPMPVAAIAGDQPLIMMAKAIEVHAGPPADQPTIPTPEEMLRAAGIPSVADLRMDLLDDDERDYWNDW